MTISQGVVCLASARGMLEVHTHYSPPSYSGNVGKPTSKVVGYLGVFESLGEDWAIKNCFGCDLLEPFYNVHLQDEVGAHLLRQGSRDTYSH